MTHNADEYYGPNEALRAHLAESPGSWKTVHREALGNDLKVSASGGVVTSNYPIIIEVESPEVALEIQGGVGYVPVRFDGLKSVNGFKLYEVVNGEPIELNQAVKGNDFWQTDHDSVTNTYRLTYNIPLDGKPVARWFFKQGEKTTPKPSRSPYMTKETTNKRFVTVIGLVASIGGFLFGFDSDVISGTVDGLKKAFNSGSIAIVFNVALMPLGCGVGAFFAGTLADKIGLRAIRC